MKAFFDAKTTDSKTFPYSQVKHHQIIHLLSLANCGAQAGYIIYFRQTETVEFFDAKKISELQPRDSLAANTGLILGPPSDFDLLKLLG